VKIELEVPDTFPLSRIEIWPFSTGDGDTEDVEDYIHVHVVVEDHELYADDLEELKKAMEKHGFEFVSVYAGERELEVHFSKRREWA